MQKHRFEAVSLLTPQNGMLKVSVIPALGQPDWLVPSALILDVQPCHEHLWNYTWQHQNGSQELPVYPLMPKELPVDKMIILEGNTDAHRLALQSMGEIHTMRVKISDVKDSELSQEELANFNSSIPHALVPDDSSQSYIYQAVTIGQELYIVPDLDLLVHRLVDLDS